MILNLLAVLYPDNENFTVVKIEAPKNVYIWNSET